MDRRDFLTKFFQSGTVRHQGITISGITEQSLDPYPHPLTLADAYHLLRRLSFGPTRTIAQQLVGKTALQAVDLLLGVGQPDPEIDPPGAWVNQSTENPAGADPDTRRSIENWWRSIFRQFQQWWVDRMRTETLPLSEKLILFWHGHFTTEFTYENGYIPPQLLYRQYLMFRRNRLGSFPSFVEDFTLDGAELVYLGGELNTKGIPNENYAREMMELFTMGVGWYTEGDVKEAARVLTGWRVAKFNDEPAPKGIYEVYFNPDAHDTGAKQVLGVTIPARSANENTEFLVRRDEVRRLIHILMETRPQQVSRFIARKIYRFFVYSNPDYDAPVLDALAETFRNADFALLPVFRTLFASKHFFDPATRGIQIKTPPEFVVGLLRQLNVSRNDAAAIIAELDQELYDPPTVAGWEGYRTWINTVTYPARVEFARSVIESLSDSHLYQWAQQFPAFTTDVDQFAAELEAFFFPQPITAQRHQFYVAILLQNAPAYEWSQIVQDQAAVALRLRNLLIAFAKAPDFQLC